ncbi:MAG: ISKra4 family transposase [Candidatus Parabeggiatoa sp.]|nr:ISKra4 family transposase [Candidatus Parabeggiatoa sp.]
MVAQQILHFRSIGFSDAEEFFTQIKDELEDEASMLKSLHLVENGLRNKGRELSKHLLQGYLNNCGDGDVGSEVITSSQIKLTHKRFMSRKIQTLEGTVVLHRVGYSTRGHPSLYPMDAFLQLPSSSFSYPLQKLLISEVAKGSIEEALQLLHEVTSVTISKGRAMTLIQNSASDFDSFYEAKGKPTTATNCPIMVLTTDGKGIVMRPEGLREATKKRRLTIENKHKTRLSKGEKRNAKRIAQVASIYYVDRFIRHPKDVFDEYYRHQANLRRPRPVAKRLWASVEKDAAETIDNLVVHAVKRDPDQKKEWVVLVDGQDYQIEQIKAALQRQRVQATIVLDIVHVIEYLWKAAHQFFEEGSLSCERWVESKLQLILEKGGRKTAGSIRMSATKRLPEDKKEVVEKTANYIAKRSAYTNYYDYLQSGYPIGTGVIEGTCRFLVKDRMDITGARWGLAGAEAVLKLRSILKSQDLDEYWNYHLHQEYQRNHLAKFSNLPEILRSMS